MQVHDLFQRLALGELSNLSIAESDDFMLKESSHPKIILYTNEGLLRIYSRYVLLEKSLIIEQVEHITTYHLLEKYAECSGSNEPFKYIKDLPGEPYDGDAIKVISVYDSAGNKRVLNDLENPSSLFTPYPDQLQVPAPINGQALGIWYQARHKPLKATGDILNQSIDLPFSLEGALQSYIASKVFGHMSGQENLLISQGHLNNYESICLDLEAKDLINATHHTSHRKLEQRGFV